MVEATSKDRVSIVARDDDNRGPAVIVEGSVLGGFRFIGPFATVAAASEWHQQRSLPGALGLPVTIALLVDPERAAVREKP